MRVLGFDLFAFARFNQLYRYLNQGIGRTFLLFQKAFELVQRAFKYREVVLEFIKDALHDALYFLIQRGFVADRFIPTNRRFRHDIEQAPRGMAFLGEEGLIQHRRFQHRNLQPAHQGFDRVRHLFVLENKIEQHGHNVDGHRIHRAE